MEPSFDLDVNNYTTQDLIKFFKLYTKFIILKLSSKTKFIIIIVIISLG